jgi:hypothetical protein
MPGPLPAATLLILYPFRFRDPLSGKWVRARYVAERHELSARYVEWEIIGTAGAAMAKRRRVQPVEVMQAG